MEFYGISGTRMREVAGHEDTIACTVNHIHTRWDEALSPSPSRRQSRIRVTRRNPRAAASSVVASRGSLSGDFASTGQTSLRLC